MKSWLCVLLCIYPLPPILLLHHICKRMKEEFLKRHFRWRKNIWYPNEVKKAFERKEREGW